MSIESDNVDKESLRLEYKIAHEKHDYYGKISWQVPSIIFPVALGGFAFLLENNPELNRLILYTIFLSILLLVVFFSFRRLGQLANLSLKRCKEIEQTLNLKLANYIDPKDLKEYKDIGKERITSRYINQGGTCGLIVFLWIVVILKHFNWF